MSENTPPVSDSPKPKPESGTHVAASAAASTATSAPSVSATPTPSPAPSHEPSVEPRAEPGEAPKRAATPPPPPPAAPPPPAPVPPPAPTAPEPAQKSAGSWLGLVALVVSGIAVAMAFLLWQKLGQTQQELARRGQDTSEQAVQARTLASQAEALTHELQARLTVAEVRLSEVSLQRSQLEELMLTLSRSRDDNLVQDLESALRLAFQQSQLTGSAQPLVSALQAADQRIGRAAQPRLNPVQRAIARDIERIQGASLADIPSLVLRIDELARQVDHWPVVNQVGRSTMDKSMTQETKSTPQASADPEGGTGATATASVTAAQSTATTPPAEQPASTQPGTDTAAVVAVAGDGLSQGWARVTTWWNAAWTRAWTDMTQSGRELVRVSRIDRPEAALLAPDQAFFLRENIKLQLLNARLGLLARQLASARSDLTTAEANVGRYFSPSHSQVLAAQAELRQLATDLVGSELPRPDETLAALTAAAGGR